MDYLAQTKLAAEAARDKKAIRIVAIDLSKHSDICRSMLICSSSNDRQSRAIAEGLETALSASGGLRPLAVEGKDTGHWVLVDFGELIVHIFLDDVRDYYALEKLWPTAPKIPI